VQYFARNSSIPLGKRGTHPFVFIPSSITITSTFTQTQETVVTEQPVCSEGGTIGAAASAGEEILEAAAGEDAVGELGEERVD
jgi:hypothetical protein